MTESFVNFNIPTAAVADVDVVGLTRSYLKPAPDGKDYVTKSGSRVIEQPYVIEYGPLDLPTRVVVTVVQRPVSTAKPCGESVYAIKLVTLTRVVNGTVTLQESDAEFNLSWTIPGRSILSTSEVLRAIQALFSLVSGTFASGSMDEVNLTHLAYANPVLFG